MRGGRRAHNLAPDAGPSLANEAVAAVGYALESLAARLIVGIVERYLAERGMFSPSLIGWRI